MALRLPVQRWPGSRQRGLQQGCHSQAFYPITTTPDEAARYYYMNTSIFRERSRQRTLRRTMHKDAKRTKISFKAGRGVTASTALITLIISYGGDDVESFSKTGDEADGI